MYVGLFKKKTTKAIKKLNKLVTNYVLLNMNISLCSENDLFIITSSANLPFDLNIA